MTEDQYPPVNSMIEAVVIWHADAPHEQIRLSMRPSLLSHAAE